MSVHYKFKSALEYDTVTFDGLHISVKDLKNAIIQQKRIGKSTDFDLQVTNAQTKEVYEEDNTLIPKNASLLIARIPVVSQKNKTWEGYGGDNTPPKKLDEGGPIAKEVDLSSLDAPEDDKIRAMMSQSTQDYDPSNYLKLRGANQVGPVPPTYRCFKCNQGGHWIRDCTFGLGADPVDIKKSTGIPRSFMVAVDGPKVPGAMMTPNGQFAVPLVDHEAYNQKPVPMPVQLPKMDIPEELLCSICSDLLTDAVMIPCCGNSFCDECIRGVLLESEDHECPDCHEKEISPDTLIPNRFLRTSVANFKNTTGYVKIPSYTPKPEIKIAPKGHGGTPPRIVESVAKNETEPEKKTIISEADSTEPVKTIQNSEPKKVEDKYVEKETTDGPPGVSPRDSPRDHRKYRDNSPRSPRDRPIRNRRKSRSLTRSPTPRRSPRRRRSRSRTKSRSRERRSGTPTIDEPLGSSNNFPPRSYGTSTIASVGPVQGHPPAVTFPPSINAFPPSQGPPPNYRFPPPGGPPPYMPPGPYVPRGMFDSTRTPNFQNFPPRGHRDFNRRILDRAPAGVIDDPLAAFNRLLREKDEQKRRAKQRGFRRSYSRSRSRSRSFSRSPIRRRSRSPRPIRRSRSRSRSFSLSRSRSRSFSGSMRGSPHRQLSPARRSPPPIAPRRGSRYRSPMRSPPRTRNRERNYDDDRYERNERRDIRRDRDRRPSRERDRFYDSYDDKRDAPPRVQSSHWNPPRPDNYFPPQSMQPGYQPNRFGPPFMNKEPPFNQTLPQTIHSIQPQRQFQDIAPPGVDDDIAPPGVEEYKPSDKKDVSKKEDRSDKRRETDRKRRHDKRSRTPDRHKHSSPKRKSKSKDREKESPEKPKKKRRDSSDKEDRKRDHSEDEKSRKSRDKKKHKDKKESDKKKKREKKEKHKKDGKEKKKEEFRQVIPKHTDDDDEDNDEAERKKKNSEKERSKKVEKHKVVDENEEEEQPKSEIKNEDIEGVLEKPEKPEPLKREDNTDDIEQIKENTNKNELIQDGSEPNMELYGDLLSEVDKNVLESYGKLENDSPFEGRIESSNKPAPDDENEVTEEGEIKDYEDEEKDVLELHSNDMDLKVELDKSDILAPVPEISKWEVEDDGAISPKDSNKSDSKSDKTGKVTNEVLKRAENAIFAKAINAIRPIEIKKIGSERAKLYSGEKDLEKSQITVAPAKTEIAPPARLSVKERLGIKVEDTDKVINLSRRSSTVSPFTRRGESGRNIAHGERRIEMTDYNKRIRRSRERRNSRDRQRSKNDNRNQSRSDRRNDHKREKPRKEEKSKVEDDKKARRKRSGTRSESEDKKDKPKKKDKKVKKEKARKKDDDETKSDKDKKEESGTPATAKRKATIDEANFEPDYDESEDDDKKDKKKSKKESDNSSSSDSDSSSSSEEERKKKKHKKHRKKKRKESSSESSSEDSDSSDSDRDRKRKRHKKTKKKKKKSKHK